MTRHWKLISALMLLSVVGNFVEAQTAPWNENRLIWDAPSTCTTGEPIAQCPVTGYKVERSATTSGTFTQVGTTAANVVTFTHTVSAGGQSCYRARATYAGGDTAPTNVFCVTNTPPAGPPNPPTNMRLNTISSAVYEPKANFHAWTFERGKRVPNTYVKLQAACEEDRCVSDSREGNFCVISRLTQVTPRPKEGTVVMGLCG